MKEYLNLLRIPQYSKNLFIFLPLFFAMHLQEPERFFRVSLAFLDFCLLASSVYIFNDLRDLEEDKRHPLKKERPLPAGRISKGAAQGLMACLLLTGLAVGILPFTANVLFVSVLRGA